MSTWHFGGVLALWIHDLAPISAQIEKVSQLQV